MSQRFEAWAHQRGAVDFAAARRGSLWNMGMGTGKTPSALLAAKEQGARRVLVLCPLVVVDVWAHQVEKFRETFDMRVLQLGDRAGTIANKAALLDRELKLQSREPLLVAANYDAVFREPLASLIAGTKWDLAIFDECHKIKSPTGSASKFCARIPTKTDWRIGLSGTPMPHSPLDIWGQARTLVPGVFSQSYVRFRFEYAVVDSSAGFPKIRGYRNRDKLADLMRPWVYNVSRDVLTLPPVTDENVIVRLGASRKTYQELEQTAIAQVQDGTVTPANGLVKLLRLRQITSGHVTVDLNDWSGNSESRRVGEEKKAMLRDRILDALDPDEPVVVFCEFWTDMDMVHEAFAELGRKCLELSGRKRQLDEWQRGEAPGLVTHPKAGGIGADMTRAAYCAFFSLGFSPGDYEQARCRVHRPGQERRSFFYHLIAENTVDEAIYGAHRSKRGVVESVIAALRQKAMQWT